MATITVKVQSKKYPGLEVTIENAVNGGAAIDEARKIFIVTYPELTHRNWNLVRMTATGPDAFLAVVKPAGSSNWDV